MEWYRVGAAAARIQPVTAAFPSELFRREQPSIMSAAVTQSMVYSDVVILYNLQDRGGGASVVHNGTISTNSEEICPASVRQNPSWVLISPHFQEILEA
jgi:hypothetical protein